MAEPSRAAGATGREGAGEHLNGGLHHPDTPSATSPASGSMPAGEADPDEPVVGGLQMEFPPYAHTATPTRVLACPSGASSHPQGQWTRRCWWALGQ